MLKMNDNLPIHPVTAFHWSEKLGTADGSTLGPGFMNWMFPDACDEGFLVSGKTTKAFVLKYTQVHRGDLVWWDFEAGDGSGIKIRVWNT